jgi:division protein CdvB (Snf7/Vps24/ESCRT-III family)
LEPNLKDAEKLEKIVQAIAKFKSDLLWDDIVGIFDLVSPTVKSLLEKQYDEAVKAASKELGISEFDLKQKIEEFAYDSINGTSYSPEQVKKRLKEYGIEDEPNLNSN